MFNPRPVVLVIGVSLLQSCAAPPQQEMTMQPVLRVRHSSDRAAATYYQLGKYHQERGNLDLARDAYAYSITLDGKQLEARNALAAVYAQQGRLDDAKALLLQVVADYPALARPRNNLGYVYYLQGDYAAAAATLQEALALDSGNQWARNNLNAVQVALASREHAAPTASEAKDAIPNAAQATENTPKEEAVAAAGVASPPVQVATAATVPAAPAARPPQQVIANAPPAPQARMEIVQLVPNVYELKRKAPVGSSVAPAIAERPVEKIAATIAESSSAPAVAVKPSRVEVSNGNGVTGMAKRIKRVLGQQGIAVSRLTNERPFRQQDTKIQYRPGYEQEARTLQKALHGYAAMAPADGLSDRSDVRLVLGKDAVGRMALIEEPGNDVRLVLNERAN